MKKMLLLLLCLSKSIFSFDTTYELYDSFLKKYVCSEKVAYEKLLNDPYTKTIRKQFESLTEKTFTELSESDQIAYLINAYNFYTIILIKDNYPLKKGIKDIGKPWDKKFIKLFSKTVSINYIEHELLRKKYDEPRIHFAIVCASISCPGLSNNAFVGSSLNSQLNMVALQFLKDTTKNRVEGKTLYLSKIFSWFGDDFKQKYGGYKEYVQSVLKLDGKYNVKFLPYDWNLNEIENCE